VVQLRHGQAINLRFPIYAGSVGSGALAPWGMAPWLEVWSFISELFLQSSPPGGGDRE
jgi:hypothetical protein